MKENILQDTACQLEQGAEQQQRQGGADIGNLGGWGEGGRGVGEAGEQGVHGPGAARRCLEIPDCTVFIFLAFIS